MGRSRGVACVRGRYSGWRRHARCVWWAPKLTWHGESGGGRALAWRHVWRNWIRSVCLVELASEALPRIWPIFFSLSCLTSIRRFALAVGLRHGVLTLYILYPLAFSFYLDSIVFDYDTFLSFFD